MLVRGLIERQAASRFALTDQGRAVLGALLAKVSDDARLGCSALRHFTQGIADVWGHSDRIVRFVRDQQPPNQQHLLPQYPHLSGLARMVPDHPTQPLVGDHASQFIVETGHQSHLCSHSFYRLSIDKQTWFAVFQDKALYVWLVEAVFCSAA
jgi:hypothetical protein